MWNKGDLEKIFIENTFKIQLINKMSSDRVWAKRYKSKCKSKFVSNILPLKSELNLKKKPLKSQKKSK